MPEISESEYRQFIRFQDLGTPDEVQKKISALESDNKSQRDTIRSLKGSVPEDGQVIVSEEDVAVLKKYRDLGTPGEIRKRVENVQQVEKELNVLRRRQQAKDFVAAVGLADDAVDALLAFPDLAEATFEVREEDESSVGYIKMGEDADPITFDKAKEQVTALRGLRMAEPGKPRSKGFIDQRGDDGKPPENLYERIRKEAEAKKKARAERAEERAQKNLEGRLGMASRS